MSLSLPIQVGPDSITISRDDRFLVCSPDGRIAPDAEQGFFASDTRFVSGWDVTLSGQHPVLLSAAPIRSFSARHEFTNPPLVDGDGVIPASTLSLRIDRTVAGGLHEDLDLVSFHARPVTVLVSVRVWSDFADLFDVKLHTLVPRGTMQTQWSPETGELDTSYVNRTFRPRLRLRVERAGSEPQYANGRLSFVVTLPPKGTWHACLKWLPFIDEETPEPATLGCSALTESRAGMVGRPLPSVGLRAPDREVERTWEQAVRDLEALRLHDQRGRGEEIAAAGIPWFVTLFGRDSLLVGMLAIGGYPEFAAGALARLGELQATEDDPERDMEPGKIPHEIRDGELTRLGLLPYTPYYGTHDATSLYIVTLSYLFDWTGDRSLLDKHLARAEAAMAWVDEHGDRDGDGFQEYATRSTRGYYNQGWKDAGDAIPDERGTLAPLPLALVELQGYAYDAKRRLARIHRHLGNEERAAGLDAQAQRLFERVNDAFWWEQEGTYILGLDGSKRPIRSVASNAGHLLHAGIVPRDRAARLAERLLRDDCWSGWGIRTLSAEHPAYNPFSYHTGTVWPHDNAMIAGGFRRYGLAAAAAQVAHGIFDAASQFMANRLPELWAGLPRDEGAFPVQYLGANVPQAWAAASVVRLVAVLLGLHAQSDARGSRLYVDPALPDWLPELTLTRLRAGRGSIDLHARGTTVEVLRNDSGFEVIPGPAPGRIPG
ncbi:MAG: glycogen debranching N-terminal domain-containing protein [Chloroflexota bacterium]